MLSCLLSLLSIIILSVSGDSLGNVTSNVKLSSCPTDLDLYSGMSCANITISCTNTTDISAIVGLLLPLGTSEGFIVLMDGGGGTSAFNDGNIANYSAANFTIAQVVYSSDWNYVGVGLQSLRTAACRPATAYSYLFNHVHGGGTSKPFCLEGISGGAASIAYGMTHFNLNSFVDYGLMLSGPNFSNITAGCIYPPGPNITVCPNNGQSYCNQTSERFSTSTSFNSTFGDCSSTIYDIVGYQCVCSNTTYNSTILGWFENESSVSPNAQLTFNYTGLSSWLCKPPDNISVGMAQYFAENVVATNGFKQFLITNCSGAEGITGTGSYYQPTGISGKNLVYNTMMSQCIPRHN